MSLLNNEELLPDHDDPHKLLMEVNSAYDYLAAHRLDQLKLADENGYCVANMVRDHFQVNLWRILELIETMVHNNRSGHHLAVTILARVAIENIACVYAYKKELAAELDDIEPGNVSDNVYKLTRDYTLGTRSSFLIERLGSDVKTTNILTHIGKLDKKYPGLLINYENLSEYSHPNLHGMRGWFSKYDKPTGTAHYSSSTPDHLQDRPLMDIYSVLVLLGDIHEIHKYIEEKLPLLSQIGAEETSRTNPV